MHVYACAYVPDGKVVSQLQLTRAAVHRQEIARADVGEPRHVDWALAQQRHCLGEALADGSLVPEDEKVNHLPLPLAVEIVEVGVEGLRAHQRVVTRLKLSLDVGVALSQSPRPLVRHLKGSGVGVREVRERQRERE
jgi:hypothetical protein